MENLLLPALSPSWRTMFPVLWISLAFKLKSAPIVTSPLKPEVPAKVLFPVKAWVVAIVAKTLEAVPS